MDGRHPTVPVRDVVCFSLRLIELLIYSLEPLRISQSCPHVIHKLPHTLFRFIVLVFNLVGDFINRWVLVMFLYKIGKLI